MRTFQPTLPPISKDVAIVGSGVAGALIGWKLAQTGASVAIIEAGTTIDRATGAAQYRAALTQTPDCAYDVQPYAPWPRVITKNDYYVQDGGPATDFQSTYLRAVGGTTWHWLGSMPRLLPSDFAMQSTFGVGVDWPITYADLEPWYMQGETQLGVSGFNDDDLGSWRSGPYPLPGIPMTYGDKEFAAACDPIGLKVSPTPQARNSQPNNGRPACCGNAMCIPICPIGAKYDATIHLGLAAEAGAIVMDEAVVANVAVDASGAVSGLTYVKPDGTAGVVTAKVYIIAANAIETAKLLLMSTSDALPGGVANSSDLVGRNLADHPIRLSLAVSAKPMYPYRSPLATSGIENLRGGDFQSERSAYRVEIGNDGWSWMGLGPVGWAEQALKNGDSGKQVWDTIYGTMPNQIRVGSLCEQLPDPSHRIVPSATEFDALGIPRPKLTFGIDEYTQKGLDAATETHDKIFDALGVTKRQHLPQWQGAGHLMGTYCMGNDPKTSVTDSFGRTHDHPNLFLAGAGLFPTTGTANPTNTIAALALRAADHIAATLGSQST